MEEYTFVCAKKMFFFIILLMSYGEINAFFCHLEIAVFQGLLRNKLRYNYPYFLQPLTVPMYQENVPSHTKNVKIQMKDLSAIVNMVTQ